jgi:cyclase
MLKVRIIPTLLMRDVGLVKGPAFDSWRRVGAPMQAVKVFNRRDVDELVLLDIGATPNTREPDWDLVSSLAGECFVPLTVGGGVTRIEHVRKLLLCGADKVAINTAAYGTPELISEAAAMFGAQCVVASIDFRRHADGRLECFSQCGTHATGLDIVEWSLRMESAGAGEILLTSIDRDGTMTGYDIDAIRRVADAVKIPVIASGGAGKFEDMLAALREGHASAVSAASIYLFTEATPKEAKQFLAQQGIAVRDVAVAG